MMPALGWGVIKPLAMVGPKPLHTMVAAKNKNNLFAKGFFRTWYVCMEDTV
jgi:hypothetical protein